VQHLYSILVCLLLVIAFRFSNCCLPLFLLDSEAVGEMEEGQERCAGTCGKLFHDFSLFQEDIQLSRDLQEEQDKLLNQSGNQRTAKNNGNIRTRRLSGENKMICGSTVVVVACC